MAATLTSEMADTDRIVILLDECKRMGIEVLAPDVNESFADFRVVGDKIRFGLGAVKNVGWGAVESLAFAREKGGDFHSLFDFCARVDLRLVNRKAQESMIVAGAFDSLTPNRAALVAGLDLAIQSGQAKQRERTGGQTSLFSLGGVKESSVEPSLPEVPAWERYDVLSREKETLGFYLSGHPLADYQFELKQIASHDSFSIEEIPDNQQVVMGGIIVAVKTNIDRKGKQMAFATLEDFTGRVELILFSDIFERHRPLIQVDSLVLIKGNSSTREGEKPKILVQEVISLPEAWKTLGGCLHLQLSSGELDSASISNLKETLKEYPGQMPVVLHVNSLENKLSLKLKDAEITPNRTLHSRLSAILGEENVRFEINVKNGLRRHR
jgi:DNA polymerase-3 subunit alpha